MRNDVHQCMHAVAILTFFMGGAVLSMFVLPLFCIRNAAERHVLATYERGKEMRNCVAFV